jgi:tetratricopeptide (TPR) repeat protein
MIYMSIVIPSSCMLKAFFGLSALIPFCAFGAMGLDFLARRNTILRNVICVMIGLWAINTYACFWILRSSVPSAVQRASALVGIKQYPEAIDLLRQSLRREPHNADLEFTLAYILTKIGRIEDGFHEAEILAHDHPDDCRGHQVMALVFANKQETAKAIEQLRQTMVIAPGYDPSWGSFTSLLFDPEYLDETVKTYRQALAIAPFSPDLRIALGSALMCEGREGEASAHLYRAYMVDSRTADTVAACARNLATNPRPTRRNGAAAVKLAQQACAWTKYHETGCLQALAAAYAEAGRYPEAIRIADQAEVSALAAGDPQSAETIRKLRQLFESGQPSRGE